MTTIRTLAKIPLRSQPSTFSENMEDLLSNLPGWTTEVNAVGGEVSANAATAVEKAAISVTQAGIATTQAEIAVQAAEGAVAAADVVKWVSGTTYAQGDCVWSPADFQTYRRITNGAGTTDPSDDPSNWTALTISMLLNKESRTSNTALTSADRGKLIEMSGTWTQTFDPCADLGVGWYCYLKSNPSPVLTEIFSGTLSEGTDVIVNGTFAADTDWTKGSGWTISGGAAVGSNTSNNLTATTPPLTAGVLYKLSYSVTRTGGSVAPVFGGVPLTSVSAAGNYHEYFVAGSTSALFDGASFTGTIDNVTCIPISTQTITALTVGKRYRVTWTLSTCTAGSLGVVVGTQRLKAKSTASTYSQEFIATQAHTSLCLYSSPTIFSGTFGTITLSEVVSGEITLDPNAAETIDGLSSFVMYPGELRLVTCTGAALTTTVLEPFRKTYSITGTFTKPPGYSRFEGMAWGPGAGGGRSSGSYGGGGGGGGACVPFSLQDWEVGATETVTIGAGGVGSSAGTYGNGTNGGNTTFSTVTAYGGGYGTGSNSADGVGGGGGGALSAGAGTTPGSPKGVDGTSGSAGFGGAAYHATLANRESAWGGAAGGVKGTGGNSLYGGPGGGSQNASILTTVISGGCCNLGWDGGYGGGWDGTGFGAGGGGITAGTKAGDGCSGGLEIWGVA